MNVATERKSEGEANLCFCLMKHIMSVLHGLATTVHLATSQHEHSQTNHNTAKQNVIHFDFKQFCIVHYHNIML